MSGATPAEEHKRLIAGLATGEVEVLSSCMPISEGTEIPSDGGAILMGSASRTWEERGGDPRSRRQCPSPWTAHR